jgi:hypothetical protein
VQATPAADVPLPREPSRPTLRATHRL